MRPGKWNWFAVVVALLVWTADALAIYTPNPAGRWAEGRFFLAGDFQYNANKDLDSRPREVEDMVGLWVRPAYSVARNVMLYGRLGFQDASKVDAGFAGGFGLQGAYAFPAAPEWAIGGAFDFLYWDAGDQWIEFQITPAVSYNIPRVPELTPYAGLMFDFLGGDFGEDDPVGFLVGSNYDVSNRVRLDAQFRVLSEVGFLLSAGYMF